MDSSQANPTSGDVGLKPSWGAMLSDANADANPAPRPQPTQYKSTGKNGQTFSWLFAEDTETRWGYDRWMMGMREAEKLADLAQGKMVLEVGACLGCSTIALASTAEYVVSVDWHRGDTQTVGWGFTAHKYLDNLIQYHVLDKVSAVVADCTKVGPLLADESFDMAFIDGDHRYDAVCRNIELFLPKVKPGGVIAFHDYGMGSCFEKQAIDERWGGPDELVDFLAIVNV